MEQAIELQEILNLFDISIRRPVEKRNNQGSVVQEWTTLYAQRKSNMTAKWHQDTANVPSATDLHPSYRSARVPSSLKTLYASCIPTTATHTHGNPPLIMLLTVLLPAIKLPQQHSGNEMTTQVGDEKKKMTTQLFSSRGNILIFLFNHGRGKTNASNRQ
jgi:hypothetical protein